MKLEQLNLKTLIKKIPIPFKIHADTENLLKRIDVKEG